MPVCVTHPNLLFIQKPKCLTGNCYKAKLNRLSVLPGGL
jgi:hypothetical protein